jgi:hypothetical protein
MKGAIPIDDFIKKTSGVYGMKSGLGKDFKK